MASSTSNLDLIFASQAQKELTANSLFNAASNAATFGRRESTSSLLTFGVYGGHIYVAGAQVAVSNTTVALSASATNYIEANAITGAVSKNQTGFTAGKLPLYTITTNSTTVTAYTDHRFPFNQSLYSAVSMTADANKTLSFAEVESRNVKITSTVSLTATRTITLPLVAGLSMSVRNATTGSQSLTCAGATGTGVTIDNGYAAQIMCDGANWYATATAGAELTATQLTDLTDGGDSTLHYHSADRSRANHTGTQLLATISDAGTMAAQNASAISVTGGTLTGLTHIVSGAATKQAAVNGTTYSGQIVAWNEDGTTIGIGVGTASDTATSGAVTYGGRSRGTLASKSVVQNGDYLSAHYAVGYDGADYAIGGNWSFRVNSTPGTDDMPTQFAVALSDDGSQSPTDRFFVTQTGINGTAIGVTTPSTGSFTTLSASGAATLNWLLCEDYHTPAYRAWVSAPSGDGRFAVSGDSVNYSSFKVEGLHGIGTEYAGDFILRYNNSEKARVKSDGFSVTGTLSGLGVQSAVFNNASGTYSTWQYNGTSIGYVGTGNQVISGGSTGDFAISSLAGDLVFGANGVEIARIGASAISFNKPSTLKSYTVATLPTGTEGMIAYVTDGLAPTYLSTIVGGGSVKTPVFFNGANWVAH